MRRYPLIVVIGLGLVVAAGLAVGIVNEWKFRTELRQVSLDLAARRVGMAKARLDRLAERWPGRGEVEYWLGACERAVGHTDAALAAWGRVPDTAPVARLAALERGRLALETYRYALAESCLERAIPGEGEIGDEARRLLGRLHTVTGRHEDYRRDLRREVEREPDPTANLRTLWQIDHMPYPVERSSPGTRARPSESPPTTTASGSLWPTWRHAPGVSRRPKNGSCVASGLGPTTVPSGAARLDWAQAADRP